MSIEISKFITLSTCHISKETDRLLSQDEIIPLTVYQKNDSHGNQYGYWIYIPQDLQENIRDLAKRDSGIPKDLWNCMILAVSYCCDWLCLDADGQEITNIPWLERFDW